MLDTYTKLTIINLAIFISVMVIDACILNDALEGSLVAAAIGWWAIVTVANVPAWLCYAVWDM